MKYLILTGLLLMSFSAFSVSTELNLECSIIKINNDQYNASQDVQSDNLIRITVKEGFGRLSYAHAPKIARDTNARNLIVWENIGESGKVQIKNSRWNLDLTFDKTSVPARATLKSYSRSSSTENAIWSGDMTFPKTFTLRSGEVLTSVHFGFCFQTK